MPRLEAYFHYRYIDVSTIKELTRRWQPEVLKEFSKTGSHLALDDIRESIAELQFYRKPVFKIQYRVFNAIKEQLFDILHAFSASEKNSFFTRSTCITRKCSYNSQP